MVIIYILMAVTIVLSLFTVIIQVNGHLGIKFLIKSVTSFCFMAMALAVLGQLDKIENWHLCIVAGLLCGLMGDIFLGTSGVVKDNYVAPLMLVGLLFFLVGHIVYIIVYLYLAASYNFVLIIFTILFPFLMMFFIKLKMLSPNKAKLPIIVYSGIIGLMLASALNFYIDASFSIKGLLIFIGAILFTVSDLILCFYNFGRKKSEIYAFFYMPLYYIAQTLFILAMIL